MLTEITVNHGSVFYSCDMGKKSRIPFFTVQISNESHD